MIREPLVRCIDVGRTYGSGRNAVVAVHGATCAIHPRDRIALTGPSGSGKSTLLHLFAGLEDPTSGTIDWPAIGARDSLRPGPIALVLQGPSLLPPLDVVENVALPLVLAGHHETDAVPTARTALDRLGLGDLAEKLPEELSGGQAQRVAVARAVAQAPALLLADEPTGQLDHETAAEVMDVLIAAAAQSGAALVVSTHDPEIAARLDERWQVDDGRLHVPTDLQEERSCSA